MSTRIDPHVHFRDGNQNYKETIEHGFSIANEEGVKYVFDMPNLSKPILREKDVVARLNIVPDNQKENYFLYVGATADKEQIKGAINLVQSKREVIGIKMFAGQSTGNLAIIKEEEQKKVYQTLAENNYLGVIAVHCEKESHMKDVFDPRDSYTHTLSRPKIAEIESIKDQILFAKETNFKGTLHICHISCKESVDLVDEARKEIKITCGATPHHLMWDDERLKGPSGVIYKMNPPLRNKEDVLALQESLKQDKINWIESDHAPHAIGEKLHRGHPSGYPSLYLYKKCVEGLLPSLGLTEEKINKLTFDNIISTFKLDV